MKTGTLLLLAISILLIQSCSTPKAVVRLEPQDQNTKWLNGKAFCRDSLYGVSTSFAFNRHIRPLLVMDVEVINQSNMPLTVDPASLYYKAYDKDGQLLPDSMTIFAINPEMRILELDKQIARLEAKANNAAVIGLVTAGIGTVAAIGSATTHDHNKSNRRAAVAVSSFIASSAASVASEENEYRSYYAHDERMMWENSTLRKTTLEPGQAIKGRVYFNHNENARKIKFFMHVDDQKMVFEFYQRLYLP